MATASKRPDPVSVRLDPDLKERVQTLAESDVTRFDTKSEVLREVVREAV